MASTLLVLDYPGRRAEAHISDLGLDAHGYELLSLLDAPLPDEVTGRKYTKALAGRHSLEGRKATAVLAYCAAAPLAQELALHLVEAGHPPLPLILFNATPGTAAGVAHDYTAILEQLVTTPPGERATALDLPKLLESPCDLIRAMNAELDRIVRQSLVDDLYGEEEVTEASTQIVSVYLDLMRHQIAAHHSTAPAWGGDAVNIVSAGHPFQSDWTGVRRSHVVQVECAPAELLSHAETRDHVLAYLASSTHDDREVHP
ncbi:hypothetical protein FHS35_000678 [Streptomyces umbrinus]|uniref:hypothetical protein n=1 Tax=Streptomyces umbrinus TaxID=67370 RepID=UPI00167E401F|nr:hypothetical protein [Streptomyces umbrinus]MCR3723831.1 hypothetical protein [Streptomyces umbrinus]GHH42425.1 hypothetical protein GCM10018775_27270 [Streptomyces umbrinus]